MQMEINTKELLLINSNMDLESIHMHKQVKSMKENGSTIYGMAKVLTIFSMAKSKSKDLGKEQS